MYTGRNTKSAIYDATIDIDVVQMAEFVLGGKAGLGFCKGKKLSHRAEVLGQIASFDDNGRLVKSAVQSVHGKWTK